MVFVPVLEKKANEGGQQSYTVTFLITSYFYSPDAGGLKILKQSPYLLFFVKKSNICHVNQES